ncbi:MAG: serine/threonine-protein kinase, partial [Polyangiales bacterium]
MSATPEFVGGPRFEVRRRLGAGGFGIVYEVFDKERGADLAIKALARLDPAALYRFKREFRAIADVRHRNLVELHELVSVGNEWILVMELVRGVDALAWVRPGAEKTAVTLDRGAPQVDHARLRSVLAQIAEGLSALHAAGRIHRDVKPSNVLVESETGRVVIVDFGIATELEPEGGAPNSDLTLLAGTPEYMAPEQGTGDALTAAADWYAVGVLMFEALTGRLPFLGAPLQILLDKQRFEAPHPTEIVKGIPQDLAALCVDLLRTRPETRPKGSEVLRRLGVGTEESRRARSGVRSANSRGDRALLVGRDRELAALAEAYDHTRSGRPATVVVSGDSGMGKTALVQSFLETIRDEAIVLAGRCYERESVPYKALDAVIDELSRALLRLPPNEAAAVVPRDVAALVRLFPVLQRAAAIAEAPRRPLASVDPQQLRLRGFGALRELLARIADRRPLVLFIDDLQWGDVDSTALLAELSAPPDAPCFLLVVSHRTEDTQSEVLRLFHASATAVRPIKLAPLDKEHVRELASSLLGEGTPASLIENVAEESRGAPILVRELVDSVQAEGSSFSSAIRLELLFKNRLDALPAGARRLLEVLAVAGRPLRLEHALAAAGLEGDAKREA